MTPMGAGPKGAEVAEDPAGEGEDRSAGGGGHCGRWVGATESATSESRDGKSKQKEVTWFCENLWPPRDRI